MTRIQSPAVPVAVNQRGQVVGVVTATSQGVQVCRSFLIDEEGVRDIAVPGNRRCTRVYDINDSGVVVGSVDEPPLSFLWQDGTTTFLSGVSGTPVAIDDNGAVALDSGLLWDAGEVTELSISDGTPLIPAAMNSAGQIVGTPISSYEAYIWDAGSAVAVPCHSPLAINDRRHVVCRVFSDDPPDAFGVGIWNGTTFLPLGPTDQFSTSHPMALNNFGEIVGTRDDWPGEQATWPFVATQSRIIQLADTGEAYDINDRGDVIGQTFYLQWFGSGRNATFTVGPPNGRIWSRRCSLACCR